MRQIAGQHGLSCLLHEKPFHELMDQASTAIGPFQQIQGLIS